MASKYNNNMFCYYTMFNNQRIQVIVHNPNTSNDTYKSSNNIYTSSNDIYTSSNLEPAITSNSRAAITSNLTSGNSTPDSRAAMTRISSGQNSPSQHFSHSPKILEGFSIIKDKIIDIVDNMVNDYSLPITIQDTQKSPHVLSIINNLLVDDIQTKTINEYWDVEAQEHIYEVKYN